MKAGSLCSLISLVLLCVSVVAEADCFDYGLQINTSSSIENEATGLALDAGEPLSLRGEPFTLSFGLINNPDRPFGCILRMISQDGLNIDLMNTVDSDNNYRSQLVAGQKAVILPCAMVWNEWISVSICINPNTGDVSVDYNGTSQVLSGGGKGIKSLRISFGNCLYDGFQVNSVASVGIRDIIIKSGEDTVRKWPIVRHTDDVTYDCVACSPAFAVNPYWLSDNNITFKPVFQTEFPHYADVAFDGKGLFYMTRPDGGMILYDVLGEEESFLPSKDGRLSSNFPNQLKWCNDSTLLSYCIAQNLYGMYDFQEERWTNVTAPNPEIVYWNVSSSWDQERRCLYSFGGYGFYHFSNILRVYSPYEPTLNASVTLDRIAPRFFASTVVHGDYLYIFGGEGSMTGHQGIVEDYFYDLYKVNLRTFEETLLWSLAESPIGKFIPGENLVYDSDENCFYTTAITEKDFSLVKIGVTEPLIEQMSLPSGQRVDVPVSYTNLFVNDDFNELYAVFIQASAEQTTKVDIMSMPLPLCSVDSIVLDEEPLETGSKFPLWILVGLPVLFIVAAASILLQYFRRKSHRAKFIDNFSMLDIQKEYYDFSRNSICFFGGFCVRNRDGEDISSQFSPTLRKLLVVLVLYTVKYKQGILGEKLNSLIWGYKPEGTASNNRNVYISRLRAVLDGLDGVVVNTKNKFLSISFSEEIICDYVEVLRLCDSAVSLEDVNRLCSLFFRGEMLPNMDEEWLKGFKDECSSLAMSFLGRQLDRPDIPENIRLQVADTLVLYDKLDEAALKVRCNLYRSQGNLGLAKETYDSFCQDYKSTMGEDYKKSFKDIIS